jgi:hypothetical protein
MHPCGGGVEYLHRDPASRRRRRKGKSQIRDSKVWSRVPSDSHPRKTALARASSIYKSDPSSRQRGRPQNQDRNCQRVINIWSWASDGTRHQDLLTDWPSVAMWLWLWLWLWLDTMRIEWGVGGLREFGSISGIRINRACDRHYNYYYYYYYYYTFSVNTWIYFLLQQFTKQIRLPW